MFKFLSKISWSTIWLLSRHASKRTLVHLYDLSKKLLDCANFAVLDVQLQRSQRCTNMR
jgi:hypothetical protein